MNYVEQATEALARERAAELENLIESVMSPLARAIRDAPLPTAMRRAMLRWAFAMGGVTIVEDRQKGEIRVEIMGKTKARKKLW